MKIAGVLNVLKPAGMSSHDIVYFVRRQLGIKKVGHTGTLDPYATGVLPICIGKATKVSQFLLNERKAYRAELNLGYSTDTQDAYGEILKHSEYIPNEEEIREAVLSFVGEIDQVPPMYSALKVNGKKLYELAREGKEIERKSRKITIHDIDIVKIEGQKVMFDVLCSKGTYIRTLCVDIAEKLNCSGHMSFLIRTQTGDFYLKDALTLEEIENMEKEELPMRSIDDMLNEYPKLIVDDEYYSLIMNGGKLSMTKTVKVGVSYRIYCKDEFLGLGSVHNKEKQYFLKMDKLLVGE
jgi:tRNA pseudouridine55 synthase